MAAGLVVDGNEVCDVDKADDDDNVVVVVREGSTPTDLGGRG